jgi:hypothetical protein
MRRHDETKSDDGVGQAATAEVDVGRYAGRG